MREKNPHGRLPGMALLLAAVLAGCSPDGGNAVPQDDAAPAGQAPAAVVPAGAEASAPAPPDVAARTVDVQNDDYTFHYAYPAEAGRIPALKAQLDAELEEARVKLAKETAEFRAEAEKDGFPYRPYDQSTDWAVVTDLPGWLSLSAQVYAYTGGAHGNHWFSALLWDKRAGKQRDVLSLFTSKATLEKAIQPAMCDALDRERAKRRGEKIVRDQKDWMSACITLDDATVILGSAGHEAFDRIGFLIPPYAAGPYAEGSYEVTLPVTSAILRAVKPQFRESFAQGR
ncbi:MAG: DUF4163 domain-containing protein [Novosphingobium sp.]|nr:DUF4163 domain-containing protein [Novosphingobium sp.]